MNTHLTSADSEVDDGSWTTCVISTAKIKRSPVLAVAIFVSASYILPILQDILPVCSETQLKAALEKGSVVGKLSHFSNLLSRGPKMDNKNTPKHSDCFCTFRALGESGNDEPTDFLVPRAFLRASEALEVMADHEHYALMVSEDNVIPFQDSAEQIRALVGWMTRIPGFEINDNNMKDLAHLADKYIIDSLHKDLENYMRKFILRAGKYDLDLWLFAARYSFPELESHCRWPVFDEIVSILCDPSKGVSFLHSVHNVPLSTLNEVIRKALEGKPNNCPMCRDNPVQIKGNFTCM